MNTLNNDKDVIILFYNSENKNHKEVYAYTESAETDSHCIDISKTKVTGTIWAEVAELMNISVTDLVDTSHSTYENRYGKDSKPDDNGAIKILQNDADMLIFAIAVKGNRAAIVKSYGEVTKFHEADSIGIEKTPIGNKNKY